MRLTIKNNYIIRNDIVHENQFYKEKLYFQSG